MFFLISVSVSIFIFLASLIFAGTKGCEAAKKKWTTSVVVLFLVFCSILFLMQKTSISPDKKLILAALILLGAATGYILNIFGKWLIDFVAFNLMSDNRERVVKGYAKPWSDL